MTLNDRSAERNSAKRRPRTFGVIRKADDRIGKCFLHFWNRMKIHTIKWRWVDVGAVRECIRHFVFSEYRDGLLDIENRVHSRRDNHRLSKFRNMLDERIVVAFARADLERFHAELVKLVCSGTREGGREKNKSHTLRVLFQLALLLSGERAALHNLPNGYIGICGNRFSRLRLHHLILDDVSLKLDAFGADRLRIADHPLRLFEVAIVVDTDLGNDKWRVIGAYFSLADGYIWAFFGGHT